MKFSTKAPSSETAAEMVKDYVEVPMPSALLAQMSKGKKVCSRKMWREKDDPECSDGNEVEWQLGELSKVPHSGSAGKAH